MFWEGRTNMNKCKRQVSTKLDETVQCVHAILKADHPLTITEKGQKMAACFSHKTCKATMLCALHLEMWKVCALWVPWQLIVEHRKNWMEVALNFLTHYKEDGNDLLEWIITGVESWIHFYEPERKSTSEVWKKRKKCQEN